MATTGAILTQVGFCFLAVALLVLVARSQSKRQVANGEAQQALKSFVSWWVTVAAYYLEQTVFHLTRLLHEWQANQLVALAMVELAILLTAFAFLLDYLLYIVVGDLRWRRRIVAYYGVLFVMVAAVTQLTGPYTVVETDLGPDIEGDVPALAAVVLLFMMAPIFAAIGLQVRLLIAADDRTTRYRIALVLTAVLTFLVALSITEQIPADIQWGEPDGPQVILTGGGILIAGLISLVGAWTAYRAYKPAAWLEKRFNVQELRT